MNKTRVNSLHALGIVMKAEEKKKEKSSLEETADVAMSFEETLNKLVSEMSTAASRAFFEQTIDAEPKNSHLASSLRDLIEKGLVKAFKNKASLQSYLKNVGYLE